MERCERRAARHGWTVFIAHLHGNRPSCTLNAPVRRNWHADDKFYFDLTSWLSAESRTFPDIANWTSLCRLTPPTCFSRSFRSSRA